MASSFLKLRSKGHTASAKQLTKKELKHNLCLESDHLNSHRIRRQEFIEKVEALYKKAKKKKVDEETIRSVFRTSCWSATHLTPAVIALYWKRTLYRITVITLILCIFFSARTREWIHQSPCLVNNNELLMETLRPVVNCKELCEGIDSVPVEFNISTEDFAQKYAYTGKPVLVKRATTNWTAMNVFNFDFFHRLFNKKLDLMQDCMFFPYGTSFYNFSDFLAMSRDRAQFEPGQIPWYVGWSNCIPDIAEELRRYYRRPYFLPKDSEASAIDWIFMGGFGKGAHIHIDAVKRPSWQAMIAGKKTWTLIVPPECEQVCKYTMDVTIETGDIFVVDANKWYHSTYIHPGAVSISIGSEYD